jgi:hypothetical protein
MSDNLLFGVIFGLVGGLLAAIGLFIFIHTRLFIGRAQEVKGTVVRMVYRHSSEGGGGYSPVYQFRTITGQTVEVQDGLSSNPPMFREGQIIDVLYDPANPQKARIKRWMSLYFLPVFLGGMGLLFGGIGVAVLVIQIIDGLNK